MYQKVPIITCATRIRSPLQLTQELWGREVSAVPHGGSGYSLSASLSSTPPDLGCISGAVRGRCHHVYTSCVHFSTGYLRHGGRKGKRGSVRFFMVVLVTPRQRLCRPLRRPSVAQVVLSAVAVIMYAHHACTSLPGRPTARGEEGEECKNHGGSGYSCLYQISGSVCPWVVMISVSASSSSGSQLPLVAQAQAQASIPSSMIPSINMPM